MKRPAKLKSVASTETRAPDPTSAEYEQAVAARWGPRDSTIRSYWQSPVVNSEINRRITGDPDLTPPEYFVRSYCRPPRKRALSIGCGDAGLELKLLRLGACERMLAIDLSEERLERARVATPPDLRDRIELACENIEKWRPDGQFDLVIANGVVHHLDRLEDFFDLLDEVLTEDGLVYLEEFVGPSRFQWTDRQLAIINRLLDRLSPDLRRDLVEPELGLRPPVSRPSIAGMIASDPSEAARSDEIPGLLRERLSAVEERPFGGAIFHQFFNRIMGNFAGQDDLVRVLMEVDALLTENEVVGTDFLWGVYKRGGRTSSQPRDGSNVDGRLESIEGRVLVGWAAHVGERPRRLGVDLYVDHKLVAKSVANLPRGDLARRGIGDGSHAFRIELPEWCCDGRQHSISAVVPVTGDTIGTALGWQERNRTSPDGAEFLFARHNRELELPAAHVLGGTDGWVFPCDDAVGSIEQMLGRLRLTEPDLRCYETVLLRRSQMLSELGILSIVAIVPTKAVIYPEALPESSPRLTGSRLADQLFAALRRTDILTVDLRPSLRRAALEGEQLYYRRATHWNFQGAAIGARALVETARVAGVDVEHLSDEQIRWQHTTFEGDLAGRPTVFLNAGRFVAGDPANGAEADVRPDEELLGVRRGQLDQHLRSHDPGAVVIENEGRKSAPVAVVLRQPEGGRLDALLGASFSRSLWLDPWKLKQSLIEAIRPSVVFHLLDESQLVQVPYGLV